MLVYGMEQFFSDFAHAVNNGSPFLFRQVECFIGGIGEETIVFDELG